MQRISGRCRVPLQTGLRHLQQHLDKSHTRSISISTCSYQDDPRVEKGDEVSKEPQDPHPDLTTSEHVSQVVPTSSSVGSTTNPTTGSTTIPTLTPTPIPTEHITGSTATTTATTTTTSTSTSTSTSTEDLVKKFRLKPTVEVGIRVRMLERQKSQAEEAAKIKAAETEGMAETDKIQRLFEKLQLGKDESSMNTGSLGSGSTLAKNVSESWKFLFDENDLGEEKVRHSDTGGQTNELLDSLPGAANIFPSLSNYRSSSPASSSTTVKPLSSMNSGQLPPKVERWKDPRMKNTERDAFKALFSSLFEHKKPERRGREEEQEGNREQELHSIFSNFNQTRQELTDEGTRSNDTMSSPPSAETSPKASSTETPAISDPTQVLQRQLENLSKRAEPIYLARKPNTPSFEVMRNTVGPHDWMNRDPTLPQDNGLFNTLRDETQMAIRMRRELIEKQGDIVKVKEFVDELIAPFAQSKSSGDTVRPTRVSLDGLLAQAILAASSTRLDANGSEDVTSNRSKRSLHPFIGHAMVEQARNQGLNVFIRAVRTESYKALLKSRWDAWHDGPGCLEILREMQRSGALVDHETKNLVHNMRKDLAAVSPAPMLTNKDGATSKEQLQQYGWGEEEQSAPIVEMLNVIKTAHEDGDHKYSNHWAKRADSKTYSGARPA